MIGEVIYGEYRRAPLHDSPEYDDIRLCLLQDRAEDFLLVAVRVLQFDGIIVSQEEQPFRSRRGSYQIQPRA